MEERMIRFITALRAGGVRISLAESADAFNAVNLMGVQERDLFRLGLRSTLVKDAPGLGVFDELFPIFFDSANAPAMADMTEDMTPEEAQQLAQALHQFNKQLREMMERLLRGEELSQQEMERLGQMVGLNRMDDMRYKEWMSNRMLRALKFEAVQQALQEMMKLLQQMGMNKQRLEQMRELLKGNQQAMRDQVEHFAGQKIAENMSEKRPEDALDDLMDRPFNALSDYEMDQ